MQALYLLALDPVAEPLADPNSYGFRPGRSTADAIEQCFKVLGKQASPQWILEGDIQGCFDAISHQWLLTHIPMEKAMLKKWLKAGYMEQHILYPTEAGTPQGGLCKALHNPPYAKQVTMQRDVRKTVIFGHFQLNSFA